MTEATPTSGSATPPNTPMTKRTASTGAEGAGSFLKPTHIGPRGREFVVTGTSWEPNFSKDALIPCLHLENGEEEDLLFKVTTKGNNKALADVGAGGEDLTPIEGATIWVNVHTVTNRDGKSNPSIQIGQVLRDGKEIWASTPTKA